MMRIVFTRPSDGGVSIVVPAEGARLCHGVKLKDGSSLSSTAPVPAHNLVRPWPREGAEADWAETEMEFITRIAAKDVPADAVNSQFVDESKIPADRTYRNAWVQSKNTIVHDMDKAREIHRNMIRSARTPQLDELDRIFNRAIGQNNAAEAEAIEAQRQLLRDAPADPAIERAATIEELNRVGFVSISS